MKLRDEFGLGYQQEIDEREIWIKIYYFRRSLKKGDKTIHTID